MTKNQLNTQNLIEEIKSRLSLEQVLDYYNVKRAHKDRSYHCPFHDDKNPSFGIDRDRKRWNCFTGCGKGDLIGFVKKIENLDSFQDAVKRCAELAGIYPLNQKKYYSEDNLRNIDYSEENNIKHSPKKSSNTGETDTKIGKNQENIISSLNYESQNPIQKNNLNGKKFYLNNSLQKNEKEKLINHKEYEVNESNKKYGEKTSPKKLSYFVLNELKQTHIEYLTNRGINILTAKAYGLKSDGDYILFPQQRNSHITGYKGINYKTKEIFINGTDKKSKLWPDYHLDGIKTLVFTAGEWDTLYMNQKLLEAGLIEYKALTNSTGEGNHPADLEESLKKDSQIESFKIFYDHDDAGKNGALKLAKDLHKLNKPIGIYYFPEDKPKGYDVSDFFNEGKSLEDLFKLEKVVYKPEDPAQLVESVSMFSLDNFNFVTPYEYDISTKGITKISFGSKGEKVENISYVPVLITEQAINTDEDIVSLRLVFKRDGLWKKVLVQREIICDSKKIITLCNSGFPAHSGNAKKLVEYLSAFEMTNADNIKTVYLTHNNGWKEFKSQRAFGLGSNIMGLDDIRANVSFSPEEGFENFNKALHSHGSYDNWLKVIKPLLKNPKIALAIYASLSTPLLSLVDCASFIIHYWGDSSMGKTTVIEIASSIWGNPSKETSGLVTSWNSTQVFVERIATFFDGLPIFLDDSHLTDDKIVSNVLYMLGNSTGKGRGTKTGGIQANSSWRTICFSTGEKQLTESTQHDGAKARTIEISGSPFGRNEGKLVNSTKACVRENYGHLGHRFISGLLEDLKKPERLKELKEDCNDLRDILASQAKTEIADRVSHYFAAIWLAGELLEKYLKIETGVKETIEKCYLEAIDERQAEGDTATRALNEVISFAQANMKSFMGKADDSTREHFGIWKDAEYVAFYPHKLKEFLGKNGFSYNSILRSWADREWIKKVKGEFTYPIKYEGNQYRMVTIKWESFFRVNNKD